MKKYCAFLPSIVLLLSCSFQNVEQLSNKISVDGFEKNSYNFASLASKVDTTFFYLTKDAMPISIINDVYLTDSLLFISDDNNVLSSFNTSSGKMLKQIRHLGHASHEYLEVSAIKGIKDTLYVLDRQSRRIIKYDNNLDFIGDVKLNLVPMDFEVVNDGFLFSRFDVDDKGYRFIHTNSRGEILDEFIHASPFGDHITTIKSFICNSHNDEIYLHEPMSKDIYKWNKDKPELFYEIVFPNNVSNKPEDENAAIIKDCFMTTTHFICSFMYNNRRCYCIYSKENGKIDAGSFDLNSGIPFSPMFQKGDTLVGVFDTDGLSVLKNWKHRQNNSALTMFTYNF